MLGDDVQLKNGSELVHVGENGVEGLVSELGKGSDSGSQEKKKTGTESQCARKLLVVWQLKLLELVGIVRVLTRLRVLVHVHVIKHLLVLLGSLLRRHPHLTLPDFASANPVLTIAARSVEGTTTLNRVSWDADGTMPPLRTSTMPLPPRTLAAKRRGYGAVGGPRDGEVGPARAGTLAEGRLVGRGGDGGRQKKGRT
jgi:hypothetical protein